jgi:phosphoribosylformylglycinamidine cyclo-ligase
MSKESIDYQKAGVDPEKAASILSDFSSYLKTRPRDPKLLSGIGPFASCYSLKDIVADLKDPVLVTCCDGVGTKLKLALQWGNLSGLGVDLVAMNINDLLCVGAKPMLFLDYYACGHLDKVQLTELLRSIQNGCEISNCSLAGGETAELPGLYNENDFDLAGFAVGMADRANLLGPEKVKPGDVLVAFESNGFHSNGYSLVRKLVEREKINPGDMPSFSTETWATLLLKPTTIYVPWLVDKLNEMHALAHLTGGGLYENLPRVLPQGTQAIVRSASWNIPALFRWAQEAAQLTDTQLLSTFNCGVGMIAICDKEQSSSLVSTTQAKGLRAFEVGYVDASKDSSSPPEVVWE